jgi:hypothetical protein
MCWCCYGGYQRESNVFVCSLCTSSKTQEGCIHLPHHYTRAYLLFDCLAVLPVCLSLSVLLLPWILPVACSFLKTKRICSSP